MIEHIKLSVVQKRTYRAAWQKKLAFLVFLGISMAYASSGIYSVHAIGAQWIQGSWLGGISSSIATHLTDAQNTWTKFSAKDAYVTIDGSGDVTLVKANDAAETSSADFDTYTQKDAALMVHDDHITLLKPEGAICNADEECLLGVCANGICANSVSCDAGVSCGDSCVFNGIEYATVLAKDGKCWFQQNLGASHVAMAYNDSTAYGWYYQWGRLSDDHQISGSLTIPTMSANYVPGHNKFILSGSNYDWLSPQIHTLWQSPNKVNNPCPIGWSVPSIAQWTAMMSAEGITNYTKAFASSLKLPVSGRRNYNNAIMSLQGSDGQFWTNNTSGTVYARNIVFSSSSATNTQAGRAWGFPVRCIKD